MLDRMLKGLRTVLYWFSVSAMLVMLVLIFVQVVTRYLFGYTAEWSEELARFLFVWVVFLGSALIMGESGHLAVEFVPKYLKSQNKAAGKALDVFILLSSYLFVLLLIFQGAKMASVMTFQISPGLQLSMSVVYVVIPLGSALMLLHLIRDTLRIFKPAGGAKG
jgi:TRAP-type transport system small permease protein